MLGKWVAAAITAICILSFYTGRTGGSVGVWVMVGMTLCVSLFLAVTSKSQQDDAMERYPWAVAPLGFVFLSLLLLLPMWFDMISLGEASILPWAAHHRPLPDKGEGDGLFNVVAGTTYILWVYWIPGHLFANWQKEKHGRRPVHSYIINALIGVILSIENGPLYRLLNAF